METHKVVRRRGSHIFYTIISGIAVRPYAQAALYPPGRFLVPVSVRD
jgi:hypothetical protein